jgi:GMP synthase-like glutamine amidotransferase
VAKTVLFLYNDPTAPEALLGDAFTECGYDVATFEVVTAAQAADPAFDATMPDPTAYDVVVPLGSRWGVNDGFAWMDSEAAMVRDAHAAGVPMLGVCFGGQLIAHALGGSVSRSPAPEVGWFDVDASRTELVPGGPWFEWHFDRFTAPAGAVEIARNSNASQAFVMGATMGLQFHPEVDEGLLELWLAGNGADELAALGLDADRLRTATRAELESATKRVHALVRAFVDGVAQA